MFAEPVEFKEVPSDRLEPHAYCHACMWCIFRWFLSVYARDILSRLPQLLATCTTIFGTVLKIYSTKKVCKKLQGMAAGWCTNVGNERGEVLVLVLTKSEGLEGLCPMAVGLIERFVKQC